jgi:hypothetical protein
MRCSGSRQPMVWWPLLLSRESRSDMSLCVARVAEHWIDLPLHYFFAPIAVGGGEMD